MYRVIESRKNKFVLLKDYEDKQDAIDRARKDIQDQSADIDLAEVKDLSTLPTTCILEVYKDAEYGPEANK